MRSTILFAALLFCFVAEPALAQYTPTGRSGAERGLSKSSQGCSPAIGRASRDYAEDIDFGPRFWQEIEFFAPEGEHAEGTKAPLVIDLRGGLWGAPTTLDGVPRDRIVNAGMALAILPPGPRRPKAEEAVEAYLQAVSYIHEHAAELGIDTERIVIVGSSDAGHFATLLGTNPVLLESTGFAFASLRGVISIGGTGFDIPRRMAESRFDRGRYRRHFGRDEEVQARLSPASHMQSRNSPAFLFMATDHLDDPQDDSREMAGLLENAGADTQFATYPNSMTCHEEEIFMVTKDGSGREVMPFLHAAFGLPEE